ncbi:MAG: UDP-N-acetylmuramoyl-tripeptide--D-alanyl-D-alanine ligase [Ignavibacteriae bacterium]|nr:UDP-N-acetylmuramoyl-tripeptide--D-alanyl-D-alanine ligase [Ignavibacteriota bacterium]
MKITLEDIFNLSTAVIYNPDLYKSVTSVSIDTRTIKKNSLFVAIKGKNFDGHNYIQEAVNKGAIAIVVNRNKLSSLDFIDIPIISVNNTIKAYGELANIWRNKLNAKIISITGSNGKTSTKEMIANLLSSKYKVHKTILNNNNDIGVPLTILSASETDDFIVLEHGTNHFGEIEYTTKIAQPNYAMITNIGSSHLEYLESVEKVFEEKVKLFDFTRADGNIFINNEDKYLKNTTRKFKNTITFGKNNSYVNYQILEISDESKYKIKIEGFKKNLIFTIPLLGKSNIINLVSSITVCLKLGLNKSEILNSIKTLKPVKGRLEEFNFTNFTLIDDTYNANPESVKNALEVLSNYKKRKNKILILGDMFELGKNSKQIHVSIAKELEKSKINFIATIGKNTKHINASIKSKGIDKLHFNDRKKMNMFLEKYDVNDSVILVKGSRGMHMEEFVETIKRNNT